MSSSEDTNDAEYAPVLRSEEYCEGADFSVIRCGENSERAVRMFEVSGKSLTHYRRWLDRVRNSKDDGRT